MTLASTENIVPSLSLSLLYGHTLEENDLNRDLEQVCYDYKTLEWIK